MNQSIATEYYDEQNFSPAKLLAQRSASRLSHLKSREELYSNRLEQKIKEMNRAIKQKKPVIEQLKAQRKFFKTICQKQKYKIQNTDINLIRSQYEAELQQLKDDRIRLNDMIGVIHQESDEKIGEYVEAKQQLKKNQLFLLTTLEETHQENETYGKIILDKNEILEGLETKRMAMEGEIKTKELIEKKYILAMEEIGRLEKVRNSNINRIIE